MLSLAPLRYRSVLSAVGGPIKKLEEGVISVFGEKYYQVNAHLDDNLVPKRRVGVYGDADGSGMDRSPMVARHKAISEALERWAYFDTINSRKNTQFAFDVDQSSSGMAAFPGLSHKPARQAAIFEAVERTCLLNWWERKIDGVVKPTAWAGVSAIYLDQYPEAKAVILFMRSQYGFYAYGHAAAKTFDDACLHARSELVRHESAINLWRTNNDTVPDDPFERRAYFFATPEGHASFQERIEFRTNDPQFCYNIVCDSELKGPWSAFTTVWRFLFAPPSERFLIERDYFFW